jgi:hypothetical protein
MGQEELVHKLALSWRQSIPNSGRRLEQLIPLTENP